jgi:uncharacterized protein DUF4145
MNVQFSGAGDISATRYRCGWCDHVVSASRGWSGESDDWGSGGGVRWVSIVLCPNCTQPTYLYGDERLPGAKAGEDVEHLPDDVTALYAQSRRAAGRGDFTAAVVVGRKLLMHVAVEKGAEQNQTFAHYVDWLVEQGVVTFHMKEWIDEIRELGNDANHEIVLMGKEEAESLLTFLAMMLKVVYEYPKRAKLSMESREGRSDESDDGQEQERDASAETSAADQGARGYTPPPVLGQ